MKWINVIWFHGLRFLLWPYKKSKVHKGTYKLQKFDDYGGEGYSSYAIVGELPENAVVFSFGIGDNIQFEEKLLEKYKDCVMYAFDPTPKAEKYAEKLNKFKNFHFEMIGLSDRDGYQTFYMPKNDHHISCSTVAHSGVGGAGREISVPMKRLSSLMEGFDIRHIDLLKMDIEGTEFVVIPDFIKSGIYPDQICVELHERFFRNPLRILKQFIHTLENNGYKIVYISKEQEEFTFLRTNREDF